MSKLTAYLSLNAKAFNSALKNSQSGVKRMEDQMGTSSGKMSRAFGSIGRAAKSAMQVAIAAGIAAYAQLARSMKAAIDEGGRISDVMAQTGASGSNLVILEQAFKNAGVEVGKMPTALARMQRSLSDAAAGGAEATKSFSSLGLAAGDMMGMDAVLQFRQVSAAIAEIPNPAERAAAAMRVFGRSGAELMAVITDASAWSSAEAVVGGYAEVLGENAARFDAVSDATGNMKVAWQEFAAVLAAETLPYMERALEIFREITKPPGEIYMPEFDTPEVRNALDEFGTQALAEKQAAVLAIKNSAFWAGKEAEKQEAIAAAEEKARIESEKAAAAAAKKAEEVAKTRAEAMDAYRLEAAMIQARIEGNDEMLARLEREKQIRWEMARLIDAGFTNEEARAGAAIKVDKTAQADAAEKSRRAGVGSSPSSMGSFAQSMNLLFGRAANAGLLEEGKRQSGILKDNQKLLETIASNTGPRRQQPVKISVVPTFDG